MHSKAVTLLSAVSAALLTQTAAAEDLLSLELKIGAEYDSNVSVPDADLLADEGSVAALLGANVEFKPVSGKNGSLKFGYKFDQSLYADVDEFNLQTHALTVGGDAKLDKATLGADYSFYHIRLGGDAFLDMHVISPSVSGFVTKKLYARGHYNYFDKSFSTLSNRDATAHNVGLTMYRFFANPKGYISLGAQLESESAVDPALDLSGYELSSNLQLPVSGLNDDARVNFGISYRERDYDNITPSINEIRTEDRLRFRTLFETPLTDHLGIQFQYRYTDRNSNFPTADFIEHRATTELTYRF